MRLDVGDRLLRVVVVARGRAVVVDLRAGDEGAGAVDEAVVLEVPGQADLDLVLVAAAASPAAARGEPLIGLPFGSVEEAAAEALDARVAVEGAAAADRVAEAVVERADAGAGHVGLRRLLEAGVVRDLAEVPALAVEVDLLAVDAVVCERELVERRPHREHVRLRVVAHQVEAEAVDLVLASPRSRPSRP